VQHKQLVKVFMALPNSARASPSSNCPACPAKPFCLGLASDYKLGHFCWQDVCKLSGFIKRQQYFGQPDLELHRLRPQER
jgi:hypothetical protein